MSVPNAMSLPTQDTDVQSYKILVNGRPINQEIPVQVISVYKIFNRIPTARVIIFDGNPADQDFVSSNLPIFKPGNEIEIQLGYHNDTKTVFKGIIIKHRIKVPRSGGSHLYIEAKDKAVKLTTTRHNAYFPQKKDSEIIEEIAATARLETDVQTTDIIHEEMVQYNCSDWDFIVSRAEMNGMMVLASNNKLTVKKPEISGEPVFTATYGQNIHEFEAELDARRQIKKIESESWSYADQQLERSQEGQSSFREAGNLSADELANALGSEMVLQHSGHLQEPQLNAWSNAVALRHKLSKISGRVRVQGVAEPPTGLMGAAVSAIAGGGAGETALKPGDVIALRGVGERFNGNVLVTGIMHKFSGNWTTDIQFGWAEDWFYEREDIISPPAAGLVPGVNGLQIGKVTSVDDSQGGEFRVQVKMPLVNNDEDGTWARVATLDAGNNRGFFFRPLEGDEVILGFINDDPRDAVVLGCLHSSNKPAPLPNGQKQYGYVSENGLKLVFDDDNKSIVIATPQRTIELNDTTKKIELTDGSNVIKIETTGITIQTAKTVTIKGDTSVLIN